MVGGCYHICIRTRVNRKSQYWRRRLRLDCMCISHKPECNVTTNPNRSVLITIMINITFSISPHKCSALQRWIWCLKREPFHVLLALFHCIVSLNDRIQIMSQNAPHQGMLWKNWCNFLPEPSHVLLSNYWRTTPLRFHKRCICLKKVQIRIRYQKRQWSKLLTIFETLSPNNILTGEISRISTLFTVGWLASDDRLNIYYGAVRLLNACCLATQMKQ